MNSFPDLSSRVLQHPANSSAGFSGRTDRLDLSSYERMDAGLTIKTREGDIVTLSTSRFSELNAHEYSSQGSVASEEGQASARYHERQIQLSTGESFSFSVQGDLNEQELADIENIVSGIDGIISEMAEGDMDEAVARAMSMGFYDSVAMYEADITVARSYAVSAETRTTDAYSGKALAPSYGNGSYGGMLPAAMASPFMDKVSQLLETQRAEALAYAQQPLSQLFDHYLEQLEEEGTAVEQGRSSDETVAAPRYLVLESAARSVDQFIQNLVKDLFEDSLYQVV